jgi:hypothetical protein
MVVWKGTCYFLGIWMGQIFLGLKRKTVSRSLWIENKDMGDTPASNAPAAARIYANATVRACTRQIGFVAARYV